MREETNFIIISDIIVWNVHMCGEARAWRDSKCGYLSVQMNDYVEKSEWHVFYTQMKID